MSDGGDFTSKYEISSKVLGKGAFGVVYEAIKKSDKESVAVKIIEKVKFRGSLASVRKEAEILSSLDHPNIVSLYDFYENDVDLRMCMEEVSGGELFDRIVKKSFYSECDARELVSVLLRIVKHMHDRSIVHRDIKAENLLMVSDDDDAEVKLVDFGFAEKADHFSLDGHMGTPDYMAPEIWAAKEKYGAPVDMWAIGVLAYILLVGYPPFHDESAIRLKAKILRCQYQFHSPYWDDISPEAKGFVNGLLVANMRERMNVDQALGHPWLSVKPESLNIHHLSNSIVQLKSYNARRRLKASAKAILAIGKMSRCLHLLGVRKSNPSTSELSVGSDTNDGDSSGKDEGDGESPRESPRGSPNRGGKDTLELEQGPAAVNPEQINKELNTKIAELEAANDALRMTIALHHREESDDEAAVPEPAPEPQNIVFSFLNFLACGVGGGGDTTENTAITRGTTVTAGAGSRKSGSGNEVKFSDDVGASSAPVDRKRAEEESEKEITRCQDAIAHNLQTIMKLRRSIF